VWSTACATRAGVAHPRYQGAFAFPGPSDRKRARTWVSLPKAGHAALTEEVARLKLLISRVEHPAAAPGQTANQA
jgi:hypothetical protein